MLAFAAALVLPTTASGGLQPVRRDFGELQIPRVRAGAITVPKGHARGRVTVLVALRQPPLAAYATRTLSARTGARRLDVGSFTSRAYLARLAAAQRRSAAALRRAIPEATISRRFRILLDALTVEIPVKKLPQLARLPFVRTVYPSLRYTLSLNQSPSLIGATAFSNTTGAHGEGIKIAVVDDGIDQSNPFFAPAGYAFPPGFPRGQLRFTSQKVIVARSYPGPRSGQPGRLALDRKASFHGTHVAGIAAGNAGTTAPRGPDHPETPGLSGVAPKAWLGNYRVFNVPTPVGNSAFTPQIIAAFEGAVSDGMDVINFSGGGPQNDPENDALVEAVANVAAAGVVPVISAGNDRDDFGLGSVGAPGTAPDAISVAAVSNTHVYAPALTVTAPADLGPIAFSPGRDATPVPWGSSDQRLVDVASLVGTDGKPVDPYLCGPPSNANAPTSTLPASSLSGSIALVSRGFCAFVSKAQRAKAAGAVGIVLIDNRPGEANGIPVELAIPGGMIADADGTRLRAAMAATGGRATIRVGRQPGQIETGRGGTPTSFSSAGLTPFGHDLKPDVSAPGGAILSSTLKEAAGSDFAVFDGTSMAAPHVAGAAALLLQRHPAWGARQVKSALMSTAGPAFADTARTAEAPVYLEGAGLVNVGAADDPRIFTDPPSLSFHYLDVTKGDATGALLVTVSDAGGGAGTWQVELQPQAATAGARIDLPPSITLVPGGDALLTAVARTSASAAPGDDYGFIVLRQGTLARRIPYFFTVTKPGLAGATPTRLRDLQVGDTRPGPNRISRASAYRWPAAPFGPAPSYTGAPLTEDGAEQVYVYQLSRPAANIGVAVWEQSSGALVDPFFLGSLDENDVQGYTGTPVSVNAYLFQYRTPISAAGVQFPRQGQYFVSVDSGRADFTGRSLAGRYVLRSWVNDVTPPLARMLTLTVAAGRPTLAARTIDLQSGVDPLSLAVSYGRVTIGASAYDPVAGIAVFPLPREAPKLKAGRTRAVLVSGDFQEDKNVDQAGEIETIFPNTAFLPAQLRIVNRPTVTWLVPDANACVAARERLVVTASATERIREVRLYADDRKVATVKRGTVGLYAATWRTGGLAQGRHLLRAVVVDRSGDEASSARSVRICPKK